MEWEVRKADDKWSGSPASPQCGRKTNVSVCQLASEYWGRVLTESARTPETIETRHIGVHVVDPIHQRVLGEIKVTYQ